MNLHLGYVLAMLLIKDISNMNRIHSNIDTSVTPFHCYPPFIHNHAMD